MRHDTPLVRLPDEVRLALATYFFSRQDHGRPISVRAGIQEVRKAAPECDLTDETLGTMVAEYAVEHGYNVHFDGHDQRGDLGRVPHGKF